MKENLNYEVKVIGGSQAKKDIEQVGKGAQSVDSSFQKMALSAAASYISIKTLTSAFEGFVTERNSIIRMNLAIDEMNSGTTLSTENLNNMASAFQKVSDIGDEAIRAKIFTPFINAGVKAEDQIKSLTQSVLDVNAAGRGSIEGVTNKFNEFIQGNMRSSTEFAKMMQINKSVIDEAYKGGTTDLERTAILIDLIKGRFEGMAEATANPLNQAKNAFGDAMEKIGASMAPVIQQLAIFAESIAENESFIKSLIAVMGMAGLGAILMSAADVYAKLTMVLRRSSASLQVLTLNMDKSTRAILSNAIATKALNKEQVASYGITGRLATRINEHGASALSVKGAIGQLATTTGLWLGVAMLVVPIVTQLIKSFAKWKNSSEDVNKRLQENITSINSLIKKAKEYNNLKFFTPEQIKEIKQLEKEFAEYGIILDRQRLLSDQGYLDEVNGIKDIKANQLLLRETYLERNRLQEEYASLSDKIANMKRDGADKTQINLFNSLNDSLTNTSKKLNDVNNDFKTLSEKTLITNIEIMNKKTIEKDLSALSKYYESAKFKDSSYFAWKKAELEKEAPF